MKIRKCAPSPFRAEQSILYPCHTILDGLSVSAPKSAAWRQTVSDVPESDLPHSPTRKHFRRSADDSLPLLTLPPLSVDVSDVRKEAAIRAKSIPAPYYQSRAKPTPR